MRLLSDAEFDSIFGPGMKDRVRNLINQISGPPTPPTRLLLST